MAAGLLKAIATSKQIEIDVRSAGLAHHPGRGPARSAIAVMSELGLDISGDYSKPLASEDVIWADVIITVQRNHAAHLAEEFPQISSKIKCLGSDIPDPYNGSLTQYRETRDLLRVLLSKFIESLRP
jgi:protein-tyrosine phosphatase